MKSQKTKQKTEENANRVNQFKLILDKLTFFWRFRCVKLRYYMEVLGFIATFAFAFMMWFTTIFQWYVLDHEVNMCFNVLGEARIEYIFSLIAFPCILFFMRKCYERLNNKR